ncbi:MAG: V-type ATPase subunit [Desulfobulbaceae bacterium]|nr:V-type ATPase subunit [Desulfobulbaceae bacterium]
MLRLLHELPQRDYPGDYLLSRIRCRRASLLAEDLSNEDENLSANVSDAAIWLRDQDERQWLFRQMNHDLRTAMAPFFVHFEINILIQCLRFIEAGGGDEIHSFLDRSLWSLDLKQNLRGNDSMPEVLERLERFFHDSPLALTGLAEVYKNQGIQGCEAMIRIIFFEQVLRTCTDPDMHSFFQDIVDLKNTLTVAKCLRWNRESDPGLIAGGRVGTGVTVQPVSEDRLRRMVRRLTKKEGITGEYLHPVSLEPVLYAFLLQKVTRSRRMAGQIVVCIEYILRRYFVSKNRSIHLHARQREEKGLAGRELID